MEKIISVMNSCKNLYHLKVAYHWAINLPIVKYNEANFKLINYLYYLKNEKTI